MAKLDVKIELTHTPTEARQGGAPPTFYGQVVTLSGDDYEAGTRVIGTSEESLTAHGDVGTLGWVFLRNLDGTNFVQVGTTTGVYDVKMKAKEAACFRANGSTLYLKADTAACRIEYRLYED